MSRCIMLDVTTTSIPQYNPVLGLQVKLWWSSMSIMHDVLVSALSVEHVFPVRNHARKKSSEKKKWLCKAVVMDKHSFVMQ